MPARWNNTRGLGDILVLTLVGLALYAFPPPPPSGTGFGGPALRFLASLAALTAVMVAGWWVCRSGGGLAFRVMLLGALLFRLAAVPGEPQLSDDVYRFVWDGRVQVHGVHPYAHAPDDPALAELRDADWERINHRELPTIYPPLAQAWFALLAGLGAGPIGFKAAAALLDLGVVLALWLLVRQLGLPRDRVVLYAWNPLAVLETAGNGHVEPLGVLLVLLSAAWIIERGPYLSTIALSAAVHAKLLPLLLLPGAWRRAGPRAAVAGLAVLFAIWLPYGATGPALGAGLFAYAERWEHNASIFALVGGALEALDPAPALKAGLDALRRAGDAGWVPWDFLYRHVWPDDLARLVVAAALLAWIAVLAGRRLRGPVEEAFLVLGGALLLSPTVHPWYVLWILPFAVLRSAWGWLVFAALVPLSYVDAAAPWVRVVEYAPLAVWLVWRAGRIGRGAVLSWRRAEAGPRLGEADGGSDR